MKKLIKFLIPAVILTLAVTLLVLPSTAAELPAYEVWDSEEDYLAHPDEPRGTYKDTMLLGAAFLNRGYVKCYRNVEVAEQISLADGQSVTIDLNGNKLTANGKILINGNNTGGWNPIAAVTVKNGTIIHESGQFMQTRPNSEIYFENCDITTGSNNNFVYDAGARIIAFTDSTFTINRTPGNGTGLIQLHSVYSGKGADRLYKDENGNQLDYIRNVIFDNTVFTSNVSTGSIIKISNDFGDFVNISFTNCSSFNIIENNFLKIDGQNVTANVFIGKGCKFPTKEIPFVADGFSYSLIDSIVREGNRVILGNTEAMLPEGIEQDESDPKFIWGDSCDPKLPYQLCHYTCDVTWYDTPDAEGVKVTGVADGALLTKDAPTKGYYLNSEDNRIYSDVHIGWNVDPESTVAIKRVLITDKDTKLYAIFRSDRLSVVCYSSPDMRLENIISGVSGNLITNANIASFAKSSYVYFFEDVSFMADEPIEFDKSLTLDLGGHTFTKNVSTEIGSGIIIVPSGVDLTFKNGKILSSMTNVASVNGSIAFDGVEIRYDSSAAFVVNGGSVKLQNSTLKQMTYDAVTPAFQLKNTAAANIEIAATAIDVKGALFASTTTQSAPVSISLHNLDTVRADSIYYVNSSVAEVLTNEKLTLALENVDVDAREVFNVALNSLGKASGNIEYVMSGNCTFSTKPNTKGGTLKLGEGLGIVGVKGGEYNYTIGENPIEVKFNAELRSGFTLNFYIPKSLPVTEVSTLIDTTAKDNLKVESIDGVECYVYSVNGINVADCLAITELKVGFTIGENSYVAEFEYGLLDYFSELLASDDPLVRKLCAAAMHYVESAYVYTGSVMPNAFVELLDSSAYNNALRVADELPELKNNTSLGNLSVAFSGAQLYLSSEFKVRFNLKSDFTGTLNVNGTEYTVANGKVGDAAYIDVAFSTLDLYIGEVTVSGSYAGGTVEGSYGLSDYVRSQANSGALADMLASLYALSYEAFVFNNGGVLPPYIDHIPPVDVELQ